MITALSESVEGEIAGPQPLDLGWLGQPLTARPCRLSNARANGSHTAVARRAQPSLSTARRPACGSAGTRPVRARPGRRTRVRPGERESRPRPGELLRLFGFPGIAGRARAEPPPQTAAQRPAQLLRLHLARPRRHLETAPLPIFSSRKHSPARPIGPRAASAESRPHSKLLKLFPRVTKLPRRPFSLRSRLQSAPNARQAHPARRSSLGNFTNL